ncbi:Phosphomethylpyrimidine kinase-domain-containing protein [Irpex rosettiformis]|uniref:Phosphomethylpyrimidine kinase-domain-containing protein n=1 Tax=Irpex rosettiformis TaxID=378272 RepID=A0ACB8TVA5_9APHY|nr:Phosphomethylpyrimidine kinase-domain-containing protein [Irpex rosettiformis]
MVTNVQPAVLTIAGTDSSGGAGIQADLKTFTAHNCYGTSVVVAMTAQNTTGVQAVHSVPPEFIEQQLRSVLDDIDIKAMKTGMLFDAKSIRTVVGMLRSFYLKDGMSLPPLVCDPVCVSTSGHTLLQSDALDVLISELLPLTFLLTPNKSEAELILSSRNLEPSSITDLEGMLVAAEKLLTLGPKNILLKGGHLTVTYQQVLEFKKARPDVRLVSSSLYGENMEILQVSEENLLSHGIVVDALQNAEGATLYLRPRIDSTSTHGTGCTLAAALTCELSRGRSVYEATARATEYTHQGIETAVPIGKGFGPLNHMHSLTVRCIPKPTASNPHPLIRLLLQSTASIWKEYVEHEFVKQLGKGTLLKECFLHFVKQDYLYLRYYARAYGLLVAKSTSFAAIKSATDTIINIVNEVATHKSFCAKWGISEEELLATPESPSTTAYGAYIIDCGIQGDAAKLTMAAAACLLGYGEVGLWLQKESQKPGTWVVIEGNPYAPWIEDYSGEHYQNAVKVGIATIETIAARDPPSPARFEEWRSVWERCTMLEKGFWDMALNLL